MKRITCDTTTSAETLPPDTQRSIFHFDDVVDSASTGGRNGRLVWVLECADACWKVGRRATTSALGWHGKLERDTQSIVVGRYPLKRGYGQCSPRACWVELSSVQQEVHNNIVALAAVQVTATSPHLNDESESHIACCADKVQDSSQSNFFAPRGVLRGKTGYY